MKEIFDKNTIFIFKIMFLEEIVYVTSSIKLMFDMQNIFKDISILFADGNFYNLSSINSVKNPEDNRGFSIKNVYLNNYGYIFRQIESNNFKVEYFTASKPFDFLSQKLTPLKFIIKLHFFIGTYSVKYKKNILNIDNFTFNYLFSKPNLLLKTLKDCTVSHGGMKLKVNEFIEENNMIFDEICNNDTPLNDTYIFNELISQWMYIPKIDEELKTQHNYLDQLFGIKSHPNYFEMKAKDQYTQGYNIRIKKSNINDLLITNRNTILKVKNAKRQIFDSKFTRKREALCVKNTK